MIRLISLWTHFLRAAFVYFRFFTAKQKIQYLFSAWRQIVTMQIVADRFISFPVCHSLKRKLWQFNFGSMRLAMNFCMVRGHAVSHSQTMSITTGIPVSLRTVNDLTLHNGATVIQCSRLSRSLGCLWYKSSKRKLAVSTKGKRL